MNTLDGWFGEAVELGPQMQVAMRLDDPDTAILLGDCAAVMGRLPAGSVDLIFADPPFNIGEDYGGVWNDKLSWPDYRRFTDAWMGAAVRLLADEGSMWVNCPDAIADDLCGVAKRYGLERVNWCIWHYRFGQHTDARFISSKQHALYFARDARRRVWNPDAVLVDSDRKRKYADPRIAQSARSGRRVPLDVWPIPRITGNHRERRPIHPNQLPEVYLERVIRACSNPGDLVLDPFCGSGTTLTVARALGRRSIGCEINPAFAASAAERVQAGAVSLSAQVQEADG